jgi:aspartate oxidase
MMKILCNENHWKVKNSKLILDTPEGQEVVTQMVTAIQARVRLEIYEQICALDLTTRRKQIVKNGLENSLLQVQDICAQIALGDRA